MKLLIGVVAYIFITTPSTQVSRAVPDCDKPDVYNTFTVRARSSVDRKVYSIQICTVVDSTDGEEFRNEVK